MFEVGEVVFYVDFVSCFDCYVEIVEDFDYVDDVLVVVFLECIVNV